MCSSRARYFDMNGATASKPESRTSSSNMDISNKEDTHETVEKETPTTKTDKREITDNRGWRFWAIFPALMVTALLSSVEATGNQYTQLTSTLANSRY